MRDNGNVERQKLSPGLIPFAAASVLSGLWLLGLYWVIADWSVTALSRQITTLTTMRLNEIGDFLAGAFAPVALIWLIASAFIQRADLGEARRQFDAEIADRDAEKNYSIKRRELEARVQLPQTLGQLTECLADCFSRWWQRDARYMGQIPQDVISQLGMRAVEVQQPTFETLQKMVVLCEIYNGRSQQASRLPHEVSRVQALQPILADIAALQFFTYRLADFAHFRSDSVSYTIPSLDDLGNEVARAYEQHGPAYVNELSALRDYLRQGEALNVEHLKPIVPSAK